MPPALINVVASVHAEVARLRALLHVTVEENAALRAQLASRPHVQLRGLNLKSLRRGVVSRCHPDRGGDTTLLRNVLELFECLEVGGAP